MLRKNALVWEKLSDCREHHEGVGRYDVFEIDNGYGLNVVTHSTRFYTGTTCKAKKLGDTLNNCSRPTLWLVCFIWKTICLFGRVVKCHRVSSGYEREGLNKIKHSA